MVGGYGGEGPSYHNCLERLDLSTLEWKELSPMVFKRCYVGTCLLNDRILAVGGHDGLLRLNTVEEYDIGSNQWFPLPDMVFHRSDFAVVNFLGKVYAIGGFNGQVHQYSSFKI